MKMTKQEYKKYVQKASPNSNILLNCLYAFLIGGAICAVGQICSIMYKGMQLNQDDVSTMTAVTMIFIGAFLTGINVYDRIAKYAGAGTVVPITGFANSIVSPAMEAKTEGYVIGVGAKMFSIAGAVLVYGILASIITGIIALIFKIQM